MVSLGTVCTGGRLRITLLGLVAVVVALAAAPALEAADGTSTGDAATTQAQAVADAPGAPEGTNGATPGPTEAGSDSKPTGPAANASETASQSPGEPHSPAGEGSDHAASDASDHGVPVNDQAGGNAAANEPAGDHGVPANGQANGQSSGHDAPPTGSAAEQKTSLSQTANAAANAEQLGVGNTEVSVRVDEPGNGSPVAQENIAEGNAEAAAAAQTTTPATSDQSAGAAAQGAQSDVQNTAVSVRVGSPGDDGPVDQANIAAATASTSIAPPEGGQSTIDESAAAAATQDGVSNTNISIRVFSPGDDGTVEQTNTAVAAADTSGPDGATAAAGQNDVQNTNVSVRVESPGASGAVAQQSVASTSARSAGAPAAGAGVTVTTNGLDTNLSVVLDGDRLQQPGASGLQVWEWTWTWNRDESESVAALLDTQPASWNWLWGAANAGTGGQLGQTTVRTAPTAGNTPASWTWNWDWTRTGAPNWAWQWDWTTVLPCGSCVWIWNWTWNWTGQPVQTGSTASERETSNIPDAAGQANVAVAHAEASVTADVTQTMTQDGEGAREQYAGQLVSVEQVADAAATAMQSDVDSVATTDLRARQVNRVTSEASVTVRADLAQSVAQTMVVDDDGAAAQWSGQEIDVVQHGRAHVRSGQHDVLRHTGDTLLGSGQATAVTVAGIHQSVDQDALVDGGATDQWAGQLTLVEQSGDAVSVVEQTGAAAPRFAGGTARARSSSGALARVDQAVAQLAVRGGGLGTQSAMQIVYVGQEGSTSATTTQRAGGATSPVAASDASATNRALVVQHAAQESTGALALDIQELTQQTIVVQTAVAVSTSAGGIAGPAVVRNCAIVQQTAGQSLAGGPVSSASPDLSAFCVPPSAVPTAGAADESAPASSAAATGTGPAVEPAAAVGQPPGEIDVALFHGRPSAAAPGARAIAPRFPPVRSEPGAERPVPGSPSMTQISAPRPTQARLDTRPGVHAGAGDAGEEPPLPPAGDPPLWVSALAAATATGTGPSGIAAILLAFVLVPPLVLRVREGSVVRRPAGAFSQVDVPV